MSFGKESESNFSKTLTLSKNKYNNSREQIVKKNKIINIRIYQNYSNDKNSNTIFNPYTNNYFNNINNPLKETNEIGTQTITEKELKNFINKNSINNINNNILIRNSSNNKIDKVLHKYENHYNFSKTFSTKFKKKKIIYNNNKIIRKSKFNNIIRNNSYNINCKRKQMTNLKETINNNIIQSNIFEITNELNNSKKNNINIKKENRNKDDDKNKIAKKYSLFNLKNDNKYLIINDGNYNSQYQVKGKISINNIYSNKQKKKDLSLNNFLTKSPNTPIQRNFDNYLHSENNECRTNDVYSNTINKKLWNSTNIFRDKDNNKNDIKKEIDYMDKLCFKTSNKFEKLSIMKCSDMIINEEKKDNNINNDISIKNSQKNDIIKDKDFYRKFITNIQNDVNKLLLKCGNKPIYINKNILKEENDKNDIEKNNFINEMTKDFSKTYQNKIKENKTYKSVNKEKNKINKNFESKDKYKGKYIYKKNITKMNKERTKSKMNQKNANTKIIENKKTNKKYDSFLHNEIIKDDENGIKFEDLLKTYTDESIKENKSSDEINNEIIGDEKTFFNNSKIPKIQECNNILVKSKEKENDMNINNQIKIKNITYHNNHEKINNKNNYKKIRTNKVESEKNKDFFTMLNYANNKKDNYKQIDKIMNSNTCINKKKNYIFNIDKNYQKYLNKEKMYNFLFNENNNSTSYKNKEVKFNLKDKDNVGINVVNNILNKISKDISSSTAMKFYSQNNSSRVGELKYNKRNRSYKNSYSKYYLNKLEIENKLLIPQLNRKNEDLFNVKLFNINNF